MIFSRPYISIPYFLPLLAILFFVCSPTYLYFNITDHQTCWPFRRTLAHISVRYPCISSSWAQWMKNNNRPNYSQELKRVLAWPSSHCSNYPWSIFFFVGNLVAHDVVARLIYFFFIYTLLFFL